MPRNHTHSLDCITATGPSGPLWCSTLDERVTVPSGDMPGITRGALEKETRKLWEEALRTDPNRAEENALAVIGSTIWSWTTLPVAKMRLLRRALMPMVLEGRG